MDTFICIYTSTCLCTCTFTWVEMWGEVVLQGLHLFWPSSHVMSVSKSCFGDLVWLIWMTKSWMAPPWNSSRCLSVASLKRADLPASPTQRLPLSLGCLQPPLGQRCCHTWNHRRLGAGRDLPSQTIP